MTLNYVRALIVGGFADLHHPETWNLSFFSKSPHRDRYAQVVNSIRDAISFMEAFGGTREEMLESIDFYTSHEGLLLGYEEALTRYVPECGRYYNVGTHMLWIGERTRQLSGAHVEYFRGIANPIGIKIGPTSTPSDVTALLAALNPTSEPGKVTLITRFGADQVSRHLPGLIAAVEQAKSPVVWSVDPMHGNVIKTKNNTKTRDFDAILRELRQSFEVHRAAGSNLGGIHIELTGEDVTECTGGAEGLTEDDLSRNYETYCDPRLNYNQSLEMAFLVSSMLQSPGSPPA